jgi:hypothetical protein
MALTRPYAIALGVAACFALAMPLALLGGRTSVAPPEASQPVRAVIPRAVPPIAAIYERSLFAPAEGGDAAPVDAPALVGIAGRLNRDAVALVRLADGKSRSVAIGESVDGWRLDSLAIDAAFFTRGRERVRVAMTSDDASPDQ